ncbi:dihydrofolate reductase [compost metagenome]
MNFVDRLYVTHVEADILDGDTFFPDIDPDIFEKVSEEAIPAGDKDNYPTRFSVYRRKNAAN